MEDLGRIVEFELVVVLVACYVVFLELFNRRKWMGDMSYSCEFIG